MKTRLPDFISNYISAMLVGKSFLRSFDTKKVIHTENQRLQINLLSQGCGRVRWIRSSNPFVLRSLFLEPVYAVVVGIKDDPLLLIEMSKRLVNSLILIWKFYFLWKGKLGSSVDQVSNFGVCKGLSHWGQFGLSVLVFFVLFNRNKNFDFFVQHIWLFVFFSFSKHFISGNQSLNVLMGVFFWKSQIIDLYSEIAKPLAVVCILN